jgi:tRNA A37 threonylcarbamoyladenosine biosynthesis protein TsaE
MMNTKTIAKKFAPALAKGQRWQTKDAYIEIVGLGKTLLDYRLLRELGQRRRTQTTTFKSMEDYLEANEARLMKGNSRN